MRRPGVRDLLRLRNRALPFMLLARLPRSQIMSRERLKLDDGIVVQKGMTTRDVREGTEFGNEDCRGSACRDCFSSFVRAASSEAARPGEGGGSSSEWLTKEEEGADDDDDAGAEDSTVLLPAETSDGTDTGDEGEEHGDEGGGGEELGDDMRREGLVEAASRSVLVR
jgi:hypothetical protein